MEKRLEQEWEVMGELGVEQERKGIGSFIKWDSGDVESEEGEVVRKLGGGGVEGGEDGGGEDGTGVVLCVGREGGEWMGSKKSCSI